MSGIAGRPTVVRLSTGIPGLDRVLEGGLIRGSAYLLQGAPGSGKTVLSSQMAFHRVSQGERAVVVSMLGESHTKLIENLSGFEFFDHEAIGDRLELLNGYAVAEREGLDALLQTIRRTITASGATLLVLDALNAVLALAPDEEALRLFLRRLATACQLAGVTFVGITNRCGDEGASEMLLVDGVLALYRVQSGMRTIRELEIVKSRGSASLEGRHFFLIRREGVHVYPRAEGLLGRQECALSETPRRLRFGIERFDSMLGGGIVEGAVTGILGAPGAGKTLLGLMFLAAGAERGEAGIYLGFSETPERLLRKATGVSIPLREHVESGAIRVLWRLASEQLLDVLGEELLEAVRVAGAKRVVIDGVDGLRQSAFIPERLPQFLAALVNELRCDGVTTMFTEEVPLTGELLPRHAISPAFENVLVLRYVERGSQLYRLISILKLRESDYDSSVRQFRIGSEGIEVAETFESAEAILTGMGPTRRVDDEGH